MLLAINIGNSNIRFALAEEVNVKHSWTISTKPYKTTGEYFMLFQNFAWQYPMMLEKIKQVVIGSVVPNQTQVIAKAIYKTLNINPLIVDRNTPSEVFHHSNQMGTDLYANAVSAHYLYPKGKKIIVDFGTALTLTAIDEFGEVLGVIIAPGVMTSLNALVGQTAQLPQIDLVEPNEILGKNTETCMQSGIIYGYVAMVDGLIQRIKNQIGQVQKVIATGGLGHIYQPLSTEIDVDDKLHTIKGLCILNGLKISE